MAEPTISLGALRQALEQMGMQVVFEDDDWLEFDDPNPLIEPWPVRFDKSHDPVPIEDVIMPLEKAGVNIEVFQEILATVG